MAGRDLQGPRHVLSGGRRRRATRRRPEAPSPAGPSTGLPRCPSTPGRHLAATYDRANIRLYVNGVQVASRAQTAPIAVSTGKLYIGGDATFGQNFQGLIDEVRIYNRALSASEIQRDMNTPL